MVCRKLEFFESDIKIPPFLIVYQNSAKQSREANKRPGETWPSVWGREKIEEKNHQTARSVINKRGMGSIFGKLVFDEEPVALHLIDDDAVFVLNQYRLGTDLETADISGRIIGSYGMYFAAGGCSAAAGRLLAFDG